ncbi:MAG: YncE family protein [Nitrospirota bacterium]
MDTITLKRNNRGRRSRDRLLPYALCSLLLLFGCASVEVQRTVPSISGGGQISVFLRGPDRTASDITFGISSVGFASEDGAVLEIANVPLTVKSTAVAGRQILVGEKVLPEGRYKKLLIIVKQATVNRKEGAAGLALPSDGIVEIGIDITVNRNQNTSLFLNWNPDASVESGYLFSPAIDVKKQTPELSSLLVYITNEDSDNVSVIHRQTGEVVAVVMVGKKPRGIAVGTSKERQRVYVANSGSNSVSVIDPTTNRVEVEIPLRFGKEPEGITTVRIAPDRELIFVTNYGSNNVSVVDAYTYQETDRVSVGDGPIAVAADPPFDTIVGSRFLSFGAIAALRDFRKNFSNVYVANKNSKDVSVIKVNTRGGVEEVIKVPVQWSPIALFVDYPRAKVYVANYTYDNLSIIDIPELILGNRAGAVSEMSNVGTSVTGVISDPEFDRLYLLRESSGETLIVRPFSETSSGVRTSIAPIMGSISVGSQPRALALDPEGRKIYVVNRGSDSVSVVDKTTRREEKVIPVGRRPYGIAIFPE